MLGASDILPYFVELRYANPIYALNPDSC